MTDPTQDVQAAKAAQVDGDKAPLTFYFDFSSPYSYLASVKVDELAARFGRKVQWRPILLGVVFKHTGAAPLTTVPLKGDYAKLDFARSARFMGIPFSLPDTFPQATQNAARIYYWLHGQDCGKARAWAKAVFHAIYRDNANIADLPTLTALLEAQGLPVDAALAAINDETWKNRLRDEVAAAIERGVFGAPYIVCDGEPFLGADRLPQLERWLETGGF